VTGVSPRKQQKSKTATKIPDRPRSVELTAEALKAQSEEFLIKKYSDLCELGVSAVKLRLSALAAAPRSAGAGRSPLAVTSAFDSPVDRVAVHLAGVLSAAASEADLIAVQLA
jgi:predicted transglutaminase-like cysteine proteinase